MTALLKPRSILFIVGTISLALLGFALYLQHVKGLAPCPLCVIQRYAFFGIGLFALVGAFGNATKLGGVMALLSSLGGAGVAIHHVWIQANPTISCGIDPMETMLNRIISADLLPQVFRADGLCSALHDPILGLSIPQWAAVWFVALSVLLLWSLIQRRD